LVGYSLRNRPSYCLGMECVGPALALLRHHEVTPSCPLPGVKRSCRKHRLRSESDPERSSTRSAFACRELRNVQITVFGSVRLDGWPERLAPFLVLLAMSSPKSGKSASRHAEVAKPCLRIPLLAIYHRRRAPPRWATCAPPPRARTPPLATAPPP
jgi:hypothetical protein